MNIRLLIGILFLAALIMGIYFANKAKHDDYHDSQINGRIESLSEYKGYVTLYVNGDEFVIKPHVSGLNGFTRFYTLAKTNDSVFKLANCDTIKLIHEGKTYLYEAY